jgi:NAD(P)-dependent dehydrogenase (short-subunit alcohol dehydrogenase family)
MTAFTQDVLGIFSLDQKVVVVTGASAGLGATVAVALARAGAHIVLSARNEQRLAATASRVENTGRHALTVVSDVREAADCQRVVDAAIDRFGKVDVLVNNAGVTYAAASQRDDPAAFGALLQTNLVGAYQMAQAVGKAMVDSGRGGSIINMSSALGLRPFTLPTSAYSASKAGLVGLTRSLAVQWTGRYGIRVNALAPGFLTTEMTADARDSDRTLEATLAHTPLGRLGDPAELIGPVLLLASDAGSYITGATLAVDGGWTLH